MKKWSYVERISKLFSSINKLLLFFRRIGVGEVITLFREMIHASNYQISILSDIESAEIDDRVQFGFPNDWITANLQSSNFREKHFEKLLHNVLSKSKHDGDLLDVGANQGEHTILLAKIFPHNRVVAFEASPRIFPILQLNTIKYRNVVTLMLGASDKTGEVKRMAPIDTSESFSNSGTAYIRDDFSIDSTVTIRIDDLKLNEVNFVKIDVQGFEFKVLTGMNKTILQCRPIIFFELEESLLKRQNSSSEQVIRLLFSYGYRVFRFKSEYPTDHLAIPASDEITLEDLDFEIEEIKQTFKSLEFKDKNLYSRVVY